MQGLAFTSARGAVPLEQSFREYLAAPIRPVGSEVELLGFLRTCSYVPDRTDEWDPPGVFERRRAGDCEDHALWAWVQFLRLGRKARFVVGKWKTWHAWVALYRADVVHVVETTEKRADYEPAHVRAAPEYEPWWSVDRDLRFWWHRREEPGIVFLE